jgi:hypothetical protein
MENPHPVMRLASFAKLKKMMNTFKGKKLDTADRRLLRGLFVNKMKDFDEEERKQRRLQIEKI